MVFIKLCLESEVSKCSLCWIYPVFSYILEQVSYFTLSEKKLDDLCNCKSEISNVCNVVEGHCLQVIKIMYHYTNSCFDWLISGQQSVNPWGEAISICLGNTKDLRMSILCTRVYMISLIFPSPSQLTLASA